ncbi:energy-coupled thiamine transporter ThiT [Ruminococcaceae bacterium OttesenSCG-928-I18]|nr:energy-coupled thiamine transporter ThiT [Ruminococcaceae bacterium OttesenSCG-928-I18]
MKSPSQMSKTATLVEAALMVAIAFVLSFIPLFKMPWGGTVTCFSTLPILLLSFRHGGRWGVFGAAVYGCLQALQGMDSVVAAQTLGAMVLCVLLDYFIAYACLGFAGPIAGRFSKPTLGLVAAITLTGLMRLGCSFLSGILIWGAYAPQGMPVWLYSLAYNAGWCLPDVGIVLVAAVLLSRVPIFHLLPESRTKPA